MKLPNADRAVVDERKLKDYLLSRSHQVGAIAFAAVGIEAQNWLEFREQLLRIARSGEAVLGAKSDYGQKYLILGVVTGTRGSLEVETVWFIANSSDTPHLVTVYPK